MATDLVCIMTNANAKNSALSHVGESGVSWATPLNSIKKAGEKMFMSSIVWSYSKDLLHHAALKKDLVVGKF